MVRMTGAAGSAVPPGATDRAGAGVDAGAGVQAGIATQAGAGVDLGAAVGRAQQGTRRRFSGCCTATSRPRLLRYLHAIAGQDAEDIASETWLQVTRDLPGFAGTYDGFRGWVATIARRPALAVPAETSPPGPPPPTPPRPP